MTLGQTKNFKHLINESFILHINLINVNKTFYLLGTINRK